MSKEKEDFDAILSAALKLPLTDRIKLVEQLTTRMADQPAKADAGSTRSLFGFWKDVPPISEEDIAAARKEMWGEFPRENIS